MDFIFFSYLKIFIFILFFFPLPQAENLGCEGKVEEAQGVMKLCDQLREERKALENVSTVILKVCQ